MTTLRSKRFSMELSLGIFLFLLSASTWASVDLVPTRFIFQVGVDDDVTRAMSQHLFIFVKNIGTEPYTRARSGYVSQLSLDGSVYTGYVYGPDALGGVLGGTIAPGKEGKIFLRLPLQSIAHCEQIRTKIDLARRLQSGPLGVFTNDEKLLTAINRDTPISCVRRPVIERPLPLNLNLEMDQELELE